VIEYLLIWMIFIVLALPYIGLPAGILYLLSKKQYKIVLAILATVVLFYPYFEECDYHDYHVWECKQAHAQNKSFAICSGFFVEPSPEDLKEPMIVHPSENCEEEIPHGSCTGQGRWRFGLFSKITGI